MMKRGWCPSLYAPMPSGDGLLVRVKPPQARLTPDQARTLADAAARHGNGVLELTQRGNVQVRGLRPDSTGAFAAAMVAAGLADPDPAQEARRHVIPPALLGDDPGLGPDAAAFTAAIEHLFQTHPDLAGLPAKFAVAIEAGGILAGRPVAADLVAGLDGTLRLATRGASPAPAGPLPYPGTDHAAFGCAPPFGQLDTGMLRALADLADQHGTAVRVTPWRALLLGRVARGACIEPGPAWITDPTDPRLLISACIGAPGCARATVSPRVDAAHLRPTHAIHVSGCAKGCAHPGPAPLTYVGRDGRYDVVRNGRAGDALLPSLLQGGAGGGCPARQQGGVGGSGSLPATHPRPLPEGAGQSHIAGVVASASCPRRRVSTGLGKLGSLTSGAARGAACPAEREDAWRTALCGRHGVDTRLRGHDSLGRGARGREEPKCDCPAEGGTGEVGRS